MEPHGRPPACRRCWRSEPSASSGTRRCGGPPARGTPAARRSSRCRVRRSDVDHDVHVRPLGQLVLDDGLARAEGAGHTGAAALANGEHGLDLKTGRYQFMGKCWQGIGYQAVLSGRTHLSNADCDR